MIKENKDGINGINGLDPFLETLIGGLNQLKKVIKNEKGCVKKELDKIKQMKDHSIPTIKKIGNEILDGINKTVDKYYDDKYDKHIKEDVKEEREKEKNLKSEKQFPFTNGGKIKELQKNGKVWILDIENYLKEVYKQYQKMEKKDNNESSFSGKDIDKYQKKLNNIKINNQLKKQLEKKLEELKRLKKEFKKYGDSKTVKELKKEIKIIKNKIENCYKLEK